MKNRGLDYVTEKAASWFHLRRITDKANDEDQIIFKPLSEKEINRGFKKMYEQTWKEMLI